MPPRDSAHRGRIAPASRAGPSRVGARSRAAPSIAVTSASHACDARVRYTPC
ncbi:hypothetical protein C7S16_5973 [Burkholderia thailandensis]|uniref:Uncharacterized protein n=1 Tax=Burkholderia thailandensis TaxID=57975 RepID=A0AAW9CRT1_BURTH|nr:hypothetical protein [Burkholderia thailandensis]MDW9253057.1 hypothetical protein [Burkholderia thailandensis]